ncbi:PhlD [Streptomyces californicus]|uniref:PhlD n=1 Tax=Streptomyces californicus TaxID=67351 RepID=UPI00296F9528|nr:PhlD [Streptomyces californicus]MDW4916332.1 PhlD [Streptomyces californicus]
MDAKTGDVVIGRPVVVLAEHRVSTDDLVADLDRRLDHPKLRVWLRMLRSTGVKWRPWSAPLEVTADRAGVGVRSRAAYAAARDHAVTAAQEALAQADLNPNEVDVLITTHTTSWTIPGLDVDLVGRLDLRPDVERIGLATAACVGGAHALVHAVRALRGQPGKRALVVAAEDLSTLYHPESQPPTVRSALRTLVGSIKGRRAPGPESRSARSAFRALVAAVKGLFTANPEPPTMQSVLYGGLFGDAAGAVVVSAVEKAGPGDLVAEDVWELVLPGSADAYWGVVHEPGVRFDSSEAATTAPGRVLPYLTGWLRGRPVTWAAVHPGGPGIISGTLTGLGLEPETAGRHARGSLEGGNLGGVGVLDVLARTLDDDTDGGGVAVAFGPGFTAAALYLSARSRT